MRVHREKKSDRVRVYNKKERWGKFTIRKIHGIRVHHEKKSDGVRVDRKKKSDWVRVHHKRESDGVRVHHQTVQGGESSPSERGMA